MPGYVMHLALAEELIKRLDIHDDDYINQLLIGSIIPDVYKGSEKKMSHFWSDENFKLFVRKPDMKAFEEKYMRHIDNPYVLGYYAHLFLDTMFIDQYWFTHFLFYNADMQKATLYDEVARVYLVDDGKVYKREDFFSKDMYYGDYDRMNTYLMGRYHIRIPKLTTVSSVIEEVDYEKKVPMLNTMVDLMVDNADDAFNPVLKVFDLNELELLIGRAVEEIVKIITE